MNALDMMELIGNAKDSYVVDAQRIREGGKKKWKLTRVKLILLAAAIATLLMGCAYAVAKLEELRLPTSMKSRNPEDNGVVTFLDTISMQGYAGSPEYLAAQEWNNFEKDYDPDFALMDQADANRYQPPEAYSAYICYTPEMIDKVNFICEKYDLQLMGAYYPVYGPEEELFPALGIQGVHRKNTDARIEMAGGCYYHGSGSFHLEGDTYLPGMEPISYQFISNQKNTFSVACLNLTDISSYTQWDYVMKDGTRVLLGLSGDRAVILADGEDAFVTVNVTKGEGLTVPLLEEFAETFDFNFRVTPPDPPAELVRENVCEESTGMRPQTTELEFWGEGASYPEPATLYEGDGYSIYIPDTGWHLAQTENGDDRWVSDYNENVEIMVTFYPDATEADFQTAVTPAPIVDTGYGCWMMELVGEECERVRLYPAEGGVYALFLRYPLEAGDGFSVQMAIIANTFEAGNSAPEPETMLPEFLGEGVSFSEPTILYQGEGYSIYLPEEGWHQSTDGIWANLSVDGVVLEINFRSDTTVLDLRSWVMAREDLHFEEENERSFYGRDADNQNVQHIRLIPVEEGCFTLVASYPAKAAEGCVMQIEAMMDTFEAAQ